jgi:AICAR transformylase/IMP cyclohydrolase PurH (only IMP cyclohydrolase domain in Aful)
MKKITSALISVFDKSGIDQVVNKLDSCQVKLYSTGGTYDYIKKLNINVTKVEDITTYPSILKGRVKTLHPKIFGGILKTDSESDKNDADEYDIPDIDLVIVDLYPFSDTVKKTSDVNQIIEKIDIGGISLIRAAAKNFKSVLCISSKLQYQDLMTILDKDCSSSIEIRKEFAKKAFNNTMNYDSGIFKYFNQSNIDKKQLRYGENPHQEGFFIGNLNKIFNQLNGKDISYNNLLDIDSAINLIKDLNF